MNKIFLLVLFAEFWITIGQVCFKKTANRLNGMSHLNIYLWIIRLLGLIFRHPILWIGAASMLVGLLFWFAALGAGDLNFVYLLGSIQYIFALFAAHFFLNERIDTTKLIGTLLITLGIILTAIS